MVGVLSRGQVRLSAKVMEVMPNYLYGQQSADRPEPLPSKHD